MKYKFWVELYDDTELLWTGLTKHQATCMYKWANQLRNNYKSCGWEEENDRP
jgi:hypothetical protein